jgi:oligopeptide transport system ATP-binding protein
VPRATPEVDAPPLLDVLDLNTHFFTRDGVVKAVDGVSFRMHQGETLGVVGESGSGKTMTALSIMRLVPEPPGRIVSGRIMFQGTDLLQLGEAQMCHVRGRDIALVFQDPMTAFDPLYRVGEQIEEAIEWHLRLDRKARRARCIAALARVGIPAPEARARAYPHEFSGGMIQRAMIAMALACEPKLLIADEPTTALDVTMEAQIVDLLRDLQRGTGMGLIYVTHNMGVVARIAHRVAVMYAGTLVEMAPTRTLFRNPKHPYTLGLMRSVPRVDGDTSERLSAIEGLPPDLIDMPDACPFAPRCSFVMERCWDERPRLRDVGEDHRIACFADL